VPILSKHAQILYLHTNKIRLPRPPEDSVIQRANKKFRKNGNQIKAHRGCQSNLPVASADNESGSIYASTGSLPQFCPIEQVASIRRYP
jgi:hypothetical protein